MSINDMLDGLDIFLFLKSWTKTKIKNTTTPLISIFSEDNQATAIMAL